MIPYYCRDCGENLTAEQPECPFCGRDATPIDDVVATGSKITIEFPKGEFRAMNCGHGSTRLSRNGLCVQRYVKRATGSKLRVEQVNDIIAIVELNCTRMPKETDCELCLDARGA